MKTIKQVADELGVTTTTIYKRLKQLETTSSGHVVKNGGITYIDDEFFKLIGDEVSKCLKSLETASNRVPTASSDELIKLKTENSALVAQISELQTRLLSAEDEIRFLRGEFQSQREAHQLQQELTRNMQVLLKTEQDKHRGFFSRLFLPRPNEHIVND